VDPDQACLQGILWEKTGVVYGASLSRFVVLGMVEPGVGMTVYLCMQPGTELAWRSWTHRSAEISFVMKSGTNDQPQRTSLLGQEKKSARLATKVGTSQSEKVPLTR
jgi:hypothetical protein